MIRIEPEPWAAMVAHAREAYPNECCGAMLGVIGGDQTGGDQTGSDQTGSDQTADGDKAVRVAMRLENAFAGAQAAHYELRPEDLLAADKVARERKMDLIGIYHSHPDCDAYFSKTDLQNSCPWYSFVVLSIRKGEFHHANSWLPNFDQTEAAKEELIY